MYDGLSRMTHQLYQNIVLKERMYLETRQQKPTPYFLYKMSHFGFQKKLFWKEKLHSLEIGSACAIIDDSVIRFC